MQILGVQKSIIMQNNTWLITNINDLVFDSEELPIHYSYDNYSLYLNGSKEKEASKLGWLVDGYFMFRLAEKEQNAESLPRSKMLNNLWEKHEESFIHKIKGTFTIVKLESSSFKIFSDRMGIKKLFYWEDNGHYIITNELRIISKITKPTVTNLNIAIYALTYHFVGGQTIFDKIRYNLPAQIIEQVDNELKTSFYWDPKLLLNEFNSFSKYDIAKQLKQCVAQYVDCFGNQKYSLSLTAGVDSRLLFSLLRKEDIHTYTYGNPKSVDCEIAKTIAAKYGVEHSIYDFPVNKEMFKKFARESVASGNSLCSLHRAHRLWAIEKESKNAKVMFVGTMGGEWVKGANRDNYILSDFLYDFANDSSEKTIVKHLKNKNIEFNVELVKEIYTFFINQRWYKNPECFELYLLFDIVSGIHHAQNEQNYYKYFDAVITPYNDIDFLEVLFKSKYVFNKNKYKKGSFRRRLANHQFAADIQTILDKSLARIPYNSGFKAHEYSISSVLSAVIARIRKKSLSGHSNFPLGSWMKEYVREELEGCCQNTQESIFDINALLNEVENADSKTTERFWLKYTLPIQIKYIQEYFE